MLMSENSSVVEDVIDGRQDVYGDPAVVFHRHAKVWSGIFGFDVTAEQVALALIAYKTVRASITPDYSDNSDDIEGYLDIFRTVVGDKMIHARSVKEYEAAKKERLSETPLPDTTTIRARWDGTPLVPTHLLDSPRLG
jgi:hypothetical protein